MNWEIRLPDKINFKPAFVFISLTIYIDAWVVFGEKMNIIQTR